MRRQVLKRVQKLIESLENEQESVKYDRNVEVGLTTEASGGCEEILTDNEEE